MKLPNISGKQERTGDFFDLIYSIEVFEHIYAS
jgi:hypothetical protein